MGVLLGSNTARFAHALADPVLRGSGQYTNASPGFGTLTLNAPAGRQVGDQLLAIVLGGHDVGLVGSDYTVVASDAGPRSLIARRVATGTSSDNLQFKMLSSNTVVIAHLISLGNLGSTLTAPIASNSFSGSSSGSSATAPGVSMPIPGYEILMTAGMSFTGNPTVGAPSGSGWVALTSYSDYGGSTKWSALSWYRPVAAGASGSTSVTYTWSGGGSGIGGAGKFGFSS